jgi:hypothetical protein
MAASLALELGGELDSDRLERGLCSLSAAVAIDADAAPLEQLAALGEPVVSGDLVARTYGGVEELLIGEALRRGHGHPTLIAVVLVELGRRAGLPVGLVAGASTEHYVAHLRLREPTLLDPVSGGLVAAPAGLTWRCGHLLAASLLDEVQPRLERVGDISRALHVARMRCALPFDDAQARERLRALTARVN